MSLLERIYYFHSRIVDNRFPNATELAGEFEVSAATAHRDISYLRDRLLAPLSFHQQKNGYYYTEEGFRLPFEDSPKIILFLGVLNTMAREAGLAALPELVQLQKKVGSLAAPGGEQLEQRIHCEWVETEPVDDAVFNTVINALLTGIQVELQYKKTETKVSSRTVEPLKLVNYQGRWYLYGWCNLRQSQRLFHLSRIVTIQPTQKAVLHQPRQDDPYLTSAFGIFKGAPQFKVTLLFTGKARDIIRHQRWHPDQVSRETQEGLFLTLPVADDREIMMKILQFGSQALVIEPKSLRKKIHDEIHKMVNLYTE